jgi:hypothetical protein
MYYRIGERVRIEKKLRGKPDVWGGMTGRIAYISTPGKNQGYSFGFNVMYGIELDEKDSFGRTKVLFWSNYRNHPHKRITRLGSPELHPKFLNYRSFKFK